MSIRRFFRTWMLVTLLGGMPAAATTQLRVELAQLSRDADAVVHGVVRRAESRWSGDGRRIVTDVEIEVSESLKGTWGSTVLVTHPGGQVGELGQVVHGLGSFRPGEEVVIFLRKRGDSFRLAGGAQGKYQVQRTEDGATVLAVPSATEAMLIDPVTRKPTAVREKTRTLAELKAAIRAALVEPAP